MNYSFPKPVLYAFVFSTALPTFVLAQAVPVGQDAVPVGQDAVPIGQGAVPVGQDAVPVGEDSVPAGQDAVPVGEDSVPAGQDAVPVGEDSVPVGQDSVPTDLATQRARYENLASLTTNPNPATAHLVKGDDNSRWKGAEARLEAAIQQPSNLKQTTLDQRRTENEALGSHSRKVSSSRPADLFSDDWWEQNQSRLKSSFPYAPSKPSAIWWGKSSWDQLSQHLGIEEKPFEYRYDRNVVFHKDVIYVNRVAIATYQDFVSSAKRIAAATAALPSSDWIPVGTFLLSTKANSKIDPQVVQLAVDQFGNLSGVYFHWLTGAVHRVYGKVNPKTQRVVFSIGSNQDVTIETGLANLADDDVRVWAHLPNRHSQTWLLARIDS